MMRELAFVTILSVVMLPSAASAQELATGSRCELTKSLRVSAKDKGKGKKTKLKKGTVLEVVNLGDKWSEVTSEAGGGFAKTKKLTKLCTVVEEEAADAGADVAADSGGDAAGDGTTADADVDTGDAGDGAIAASDTGATTTGDGGGDTGGGGGMDATDSPYAGDEGLGGEPEGEPEPEPDYGDTGGGDYMLRVGGDLAFVLPIGNWMDASSIGIGAMARGEYLLMADLVLTARIGYIYHLEKNGFSTSELPILFGAKYYLNFLLAGLYGAVDIGLVNLGVCTNLFGVGLCASSMKFGATAGVGYELSGIGPGVMDFRAQLFLPSLADAGDFFGLMVTAGYAIPIL